MLEGCRMHVGRGGGAVPSDRTLHAECALKNFEDQSEVTALDRWQVCISEFRCKIVSTQSMRQIPIYKDESV